LLPGAYRVEEARDKLAAMGELSADEVERLLSIYGGRSIELATLVESEGCSVFEAAVLFSIREEMARTLIDIVHRRLMIGLDADQGRARYAQVASVAAAELGWDDATRDAQLGALTAYSDSLGV
jgi:glycerol-3-phosphate dehydrogenase